MQHPNPSLGTSHITQLISLYGYSMACYIPALLLCIIPIGILQWLFISYAFINSTFFMILNLKKHIEGTQVKSVVVFGVIGGIQLAFFLVTMLVFVQVDPNSK